MAKERLKSPRARLFTALDLPEDVRSALGEWQQRAVAADDALRAPAAETLHVTLCFLGYLPERRIDDVAALVAGLGARPVEMRFELDVVGVPRGRPRLYAASAPSEAAGELTSELGARLEAQRLYRPEKRPFWSHVTVARVRPERASGGRRRARPMRVSAPPPRLPERLAQPFGAVRVALYRSILRPQGAEYAFLTGLDLPFPEGTKKE